MEHKTFIGRLIETYKAKKLEKEKDKPKYRIGDLYCGKIVKKHSSSFLKKGLEEHKFYHIKDFAIFIQKTGLQYTHVKSNQTLGLLTWIDCKDYCILDDSLKSFQETFPIKMREMNLTEDTMLSFNDICVIEEELNKRYYPDMEIVDMFK